MPYDVMTLYTYAGATEQALDWIEKGLAARDPNLPYIMAPDFDSLRSQPRLRAVVKQMNLPD
jgi:hypothetical protein